MANEPPPASTATYIIICSGRTQAQAAKDYKDKIAAASLCAANLCAFIQMKHKVQSGDFVAVSVLQHEMMDNMGSWNKQEAELKVEEMFELLDELEEKFSGHSY